MSTGHLSFVLSTRRQQPRSMPGQRPGTFGRGPPSQSEHRRQSISSPRSLRFAVWSSAVPLAGGPERSASSSLRLRRRQPSASGARSAPAPCSTLARRAVLHDLDAALPGRLRRGRCACPPPPLASRAHRGLRAHRRPLRVCRSRLHFADRLRAGTGRCSGSGRRPGWVCWGRPLLSRPRGAVGSGPAAVLAAVDSAAVSAVAWSCGCVVGFGWL